MNQTVQEELPLGLPKKKAQQLLRVNTVRLVGRLTHDPEIRSAIGDKMIVHLNLALNRPYQNGAGYPRQEVTFVPVTAWDRVGSFAVQRLKKGNPVFVEGRLRSDRWKTSGGEIRSALKIEAVKLQPLALAA